MKVGFLGGVNPHALAIARHFSSIGWDCFGIGRGEVKSAPLFQAPDGYRYYQAAIGSQNGTVHKVLNLEQPEVIVNLCAQGEGAASFGPEAWMFYRTNCAYLAQLCETLRKREWLQRFIHISTSELYGSTDKPASEDDPIRATSPYSISKAAFDQHLQVLHRVHGFRMNIVRPSNCITIGQQLHRIVPRALLAAMGGRRLRLEGGGVARKSFLDSEDLAKGLLLICENGAIGQTFNVGPQNPVSVLEVVQICAEVTGVPFESFVDIVPSRTGEDSQYWLDSSKVRSLGWEQTITLMHGIERMRDWVLRYKDALLALPSDYKVTP